MKKQNRENDSNIHRQETEEATGREKVGKAAIRKRRTQEKIATKPKIAEGKDIKEKVEQINMKEGNIKTGNTFSVLQEHYQKPILEEEELPSITIIDIEEKI